MLGAGQGSGIKKRCHCERQRGNLVNYSFMSSWGLTPGPRFSLSIKRKYDLGSGLRVQNDKNFINFCKKEQDYWIAALTIVRSQ